MDRSIERAAISLELVLGFGMLRFSLVEGRSLPFVAVSLVQFIGDPFYLACRAEFVRRCVVRVAARFRVSPDVPCAVFGGFLDEVEALFVECIERSGDGAVDPLSLSVS